MDQEVQTEFLEVTYQMAALLHAWNDFVAAVTSEI